MEKRMRSMLEELSSYAPMKDRDLFVESRARQVVASFSHLVTLINESYGSEDADDLVRRLVNAARSGDDAKFTRKIRQIMERKQKARTAV